MNIQDETTKNVPLPTSPDILLKTLDMLDIDYRIYKHEPIFTVEEGIHLKAEIPGVHCRNLFLRDKKKKMFLVVAANETKINLKTLPDLIGSARLSFGSTERLWMYLGIRPGSVCPFCVMNDKEHAVQVILDASMMKADIVNYHPLDNAQTISLTPDNMLKFFTHTGHKPQIIDIK
ncbi:MAG: prolyl-tRNA synthetase associated domain-containing protein [Alphaproteobacteria bacterium]|nr:prolyl-tRNA synthetase associated domain-containing protein [Alphaproteobacteria bacterium]